MERIHSEFKNGKTKSVMLKPREGAVFRRGRPEKDNSKASKVQATFYILIRVIVT